VEAGKKESKLVREERGEGRMWNIISASYSMTEEVVILVKIVTVK
jgi:hypothetical protein